MRSSKVTPASAFCSAGCWKALAARSRKNSEVFSPGFRSLSGFGLASSRVDLLDHPRHPALELAANAGRARVQ
jgi:hypothetical protein